MQRRPTVRPLGGAEVLVAVRGPSPGEGGGKKQVNVSLFLRRGQLIKWRRSEVVGHYAMPADRGQMA